MKKFIIITLSIFLMACGNQKQDISKLEEWEMQYKKHVRHIANYMYIEKLSWNKNDHIVKKDETILIKSKQLLENCNIIVENTLQNDCKNTITEQINILDNIFTDGNFTKNEEDFKKYTENRKIFEEKLKLYIDEQKLK